MLRLNLAVLFLTFSLPENNQQISAKDLERGKKNIYLRIRLGVEGLRIGWCKREKRVRKRQVFYR